MTKVMGNGEGVRGKGRNGRGETGKGGRGEEDRQEKEFETVKVEQEALISRNPIESGKSNVCAKGPAFSNKATDLWPLTSSLCFYAFISRY
jgi:hypothetical protein